MILNFPTFLEININKGLESLKDGKGIPFKWFSLFIVLFLFHNREYLSEVIDLEIETDGTQLPVQLWTTILSSNWEGANAILFGNEFSYMIRKRLMHVVENFPLMLRTFLRPIDYKVHL